MSRQTVPYLKFKPKDFNDATWRAITEAWENGLSDRETAFYVSKKDGTQEFTPTEFAEIVNNNSDLSDLKVALASDLIRKAKFTVNESLQEGDIKTAKWYLEKKAADEFCSKSAVEVNKAVVTLSIEEKEKVAEELLKKLEDGE